MVTAYIMCLCLSLLYRIAQNHFLNQFSDICWASSIYPCNQSTDLKYDWIDSDLDVCVFLCVDRFTEINNKYLYLEQSAATFFKLGLDLDTNGKGTNYCKFLFSVALLVLLSTNVFLTTSQALFKFLGMVFDFDESLKNFNNGV